MGIRFTVFVCFCLAISVIDSKTMRIPDVLLGLLLVFLLFFDREQGIPVLFNQGLAALAGFVLFGGIYAATGGLGFGDVKYAAVIGYALGLEKAYTAFFFASAGGLLLYGFGIIVLHWHMRMKLPFAPLLAAGSMGALLVNRPVAGYLP